MKYEQLNELKYNAQNGKTYLLYFLKFWKAEDKKNDFIVKYQIRGAHKDFFCYGRISKKRALDDLQSTSRDVDGLTDQELQQEIQQHLKRLLIHVIERGLDKGFEESNTEFVFYSKPLIAKRMWQE
jgi:hypothetical protein